VNDTWELINQWFYELPGSYILREPGKIFSLFLAVTGLWLILEKTVSESRRLHNFYTESKETQKIDTEEEKSDSQLDLSRPSSLVRRLRQRSQSVSSYVLVGLTVISLGLPFVVLNENYNYLEYPQMVQTINQECENEKVLYLPHHTYHTTHYSPEIFVTNLRFQFRCPTVEIVTSLVSSEQFGDLELTQTRAAKRLEELEKQAVMDNKVKPFLDFVKTRDTKYLVIETYNNELLTNLNQLLQQELEVWQREETLYSYRVSE
jgi:hypothetical protein